LRSLERTPKLRIGSLEGRKLQQQREEKMIDASVTPLTIRAQVRQIVASDTFARSPRMRRFLEFIVEETLAGRSDQLGEYSIGIAVFDRGDDFEPAVDPIVRNDARRLRFKLLEYYRQGSHRAGSVLIEIPKGAYVPIFLPMHACKAETLLPVPSDSPRRLAVLPFDVLSIESNGALYGRALCMSLTASLTNLHGLEAVAHGYLREQTIRETASELRLSHIIHGSVLNSSDRCRVIVNLIHMPNGTQLWAREFDFDNGEMLMLQSEITRSVLTEVTSRLGLHRPHTAELSLAA
jgi:TolB-like protein